MSAAKWIAWRYFWKRRQVSFLPLLTTTAIIGVMIGVAALITVLSVMRGFNAELTKRLLGFNSHLTIEPKEESSHIDDSDLEKIFKGISAVKFFMPYVEGEAILEAKVGDDLMSQGVRVRGIDLEKFSAQRHIGFYFPNQQKDFSGAILGDELSSNLLLYPDFSDQVELIAPLSTMGPHGDFLPAKETYRVSGLFRSGMYQYDTGYLFLPYKEANRLLGMQGRSGIAVELDDIKKTPNTAKVLAQRIGDDFIVSTWLEKDQKLFAALKLERISMGIILAMVILISSFTIMGIILMMAASREKDIALLESMGMQKRTIRRIFLLQGTIIGIIGSSLGVSLSIFLCYTIKNWNIRLPSAYYLEYLPVDLSSYTFIMFWISGIIIATLASAWPTIFVGKRSPITVLRYE